MTLQNAFEGLATEAKQDAGNTSLEATVTALGVLLTELQQKIEPSDLASLATAARQDAAAARLDSIITALTGIFGAVDGLEGFTDGLEAAFSVLNGKDFATQTTAAAILSKLSNDPATQTTVEAIRLLLAGTLTVGLPAGAATAARQDATISGLASIDGHVDGVEGLLATLTGKDYATQTTLTAVLAKLSADPATQTTLAAVLAALQGTLTVGLPTGAATASNQATLNGKDFSTEATLAALSAKYPALAALADAVANPSLTRVATFLHGYNGATWDRLRSDTANGLDVDVTRLPRVSVAFSFTANAQSQQLDVTGMSSVGIQFATGVSPNMTIAPQVSLDGGTTWTVALIIQANSSLQSAATAISGGGASGAHWNCQLPSGATHFRLLITAYTSGTAAGVIAALAVPSTTIQVANAITVGQSTAQIGFVQAASIWWDDTSTPLAGAGTFTGTARDTTGSPTGASSQAVASRGQTEVRVAAIADVAGDLYLEVSADSSTWYRVKKVSLSQPDGTSRFYGEIILRPSTRYTRAAFVNGVGAQSVFRVFTTHFGG